MLSMGTVAVRAKEREQPLTRSEKSSRKNSASGGRDSCPTFCLLRRGHGQHSATARQEISLALKKRLDAEENFTGSYSKLIKIIK